MQFHSFEIFVVLIPLVSLAATGLTDSKEEASNSAPEFLKPPQSVKLSKFSLTQKGYIQFLRYITPVPSIGDFTFCVWMRSANLTYSHPLLSYSKHEEERLIRAWVTPGGENIMLALREIEILNVPVHLKENQWYHICQSWSTKTGHWDLFLNGKLKSHGYNTKARGQILSKDGDIVVGQEYTDFDKGLDDGIEGDVFGFNMVLSSTTSPPKSQRHQKEPTAYSNRRVSVTVPERIKGHYILASGPLYLRRISKSLENNEITPTANNNTSENITSKNETNDSSVRSKRQSYNFYQGNPYVRIVPATPREKIIIKQINPYYYHYPLSNQYGHNYQYAQYSDPVRAPFSDHVRPAFSDQIRPSFSEQIRPPFSDQIRSSFSEQIRPSFSEQIRPPFSDQVRPQVSILRNTDPVRSPVPIVKNKNSRTSNDIPIYSPKSLGLQLVEMSFRCDVGKGAPLKGKDVLISWTKSPVRVFGGAILKKVDPFCY